MERRFAGYAFKRVGAIQPERNGRGALVEERPDSPTGLPLHKYGEGPFCRFRIAREGRWRHAGIYLLTCGDTVRYVGQCENLTMIWNSVGRIARSAVRRKGGQQTHCRINALILNEAKRKAEVVLWFHAIAEDVGRRTLKARLVAGLNPLWNLTATGFPRPSSPRAGVLSQAQARPLAVSAAHPVREGSAVAMERRFAGLPFSYVGPIRPDRDERGEVIEESPQLRFRNPTGLPLHKYGEGPFCRFRVGLGWQWSGIYVLMNRSEALYVGECQNLEDRWGTTGYGRISPRACYKGGQETNCRINNLISTGTRAGVVFDLWFRPIEGDKQARLAVESELRAALKPPWNR